MKNLLFKFSCINCREVLPIIVIVILFLTPSILFSQNTSTAGYRNIDSYLADFTKNELFIKNSLNDYSNSIIENQAVGRSTVSSKQIIGKLKKINIILRQFDKGFEKNTTLRDSFIKMNEKTIECLTNGTLILNDYLSQTSKNVNDININLNQRDKNLVSYFDELKRYEKSKNDFGLVYNKHLKNLIGKNVFEYNAYQNILFYKINVMDQRIQAAILCINEGDFSEGIISLNSIYENVILKTNLYKDDFNDISLNNENITYSKFVRGQNEIIIPFFNDYRKEHEALQLLKESQLPETKLSISNYNIAVRSYNLSKNKLFDLLIEIQKNKTILYDKWFDVNRAFLKNNIKMTDLHDIYTNNNE